MRFCDRTFYSENTGLVNYMHFLPYIHTYMYINKMPVCLCVCVYVYLFNAEATNVRKQFSWL